MNIGEVGVIGKVTRPWPNLANRIEDYVMREYPELLAVDCWLSGSRIWTHAYDEGPPRSSSDWDVITPSERHRAELVRQLGLVEAADCRPSLAEGTVDRAGKKYRAPSGATVDIWLAPAGIEDALRAYPERSHGHCRVAYDTVTRAVIVLANPHPRGPTQSAPETPF